ncbi:MAG: lipid-A-disaccharide synthase [Bacteroidetes bacterium]|nr:lipid-A-disaccharide synthase [Bacteroidota bacterium]
MKYYIIAGEASGDIHGANLMKSLRELDPDSAFRVWGGDRMAGQGGHLVKHYRDLAFMGFVEVLFNLRTILSNMSFCKKDILEYAPDVLILIDYPGFNLRIAEFAHQHNLRVVYYISPQIWAWKKNRVHTIRRVVDKMIVILPFETSFYQTYGVEVDYVGHPLLDHLNAQPPASRADFLRKHGLKDQPVIALLPGSRKQEVTGMLNEMLKIVPHYPDHQFVVGGVSTLSPEVYHWLDKSGRVKVIFNDMTNLLHASEAALVTSGTATLETALMRVPQVVCYKGNYFSYQIARRIVDVKYISLVNLIMDKPVVTELIQNDLNERNLKKQLDLLLFDKEVRSRMLADYQQLIELLGNHGASDRAAEIISRLLQKQNLVVR